MSATEFKIRVITPAEEVVSTTVSAAVLPAFDGERGILPGHQDFIGRLGTGVLRLVGKGGEEQRFMVSEGIYEVEGGDLKILARLGKTPGQIDLEAQRSEEKSAEARLQTLSAYSDDYHVVQSELARVRASIKVLAG